MKHSMVYSRNRRDLGGSAQVLEDKGLTVSQVAKRLGCGKSTVYNLLEAGKLVSYKIGMSQGIRVRESEVARYQKEREEEVAS